MISCYIIGNAMTIESLIPHIEKFPLTRLIGCSVNISGSLDTVLPELPKLLFVETSFLSKFKSVLVNLGKKCNIIYIAETTSFAYEAFETYALDYLMKPLTFDLFERSINKFINFSLLAPAVPSESSSQVKKNRMISESFFIRADAKGTREIQIKCREVVYIESEENYVRVHTEEQNYLSHNTLKDMEINLTGDFFIRVHKSFIVNCDKISFVEGSVIVLNEKVKIPIGLTYRKAFFDRVSQKAIKKRTFSSIMGASKYMVYVLLINDILADATAFI